jgi:hypothetical protein
MGLFGKLEENLHHGGIKVHVQAPSSVPGNQVIPVTVTITADSSQTINSVKAEIKAQVREEGLKMGSMNGMSGGSFGVGGGRSTYQTVAKVESREPFTINPGETRTINLQLYLNGSAGNGNMRAPLGGALGALASVAQNFERVNYMYSVHASVNVQGISLDPSDKQPIEILPPVENAQAVQSTQTINNLQDNNQPQATQPIPPIPNISPAPTQPTNNIDPNQQTY